MPAFFSATLAGTGAAIKVADAADLDRYVVVGMSGNANARIGFTAAEAPSGFKVPYPGMQTPLVLPAGEELWVSADSGYDVYVLASGTLG